MQSDITFANSSICNLATDTYATSVGSAYLVDGKLFLDKQSSATYIYDFDYATNVFKPYAYKIEYNIDSDDKTFNSRYASDISIELVISFYKKDSDGEYIASAFQRIVLFPFLSHELGKVTGDIVLNTKYNMVKSIAITFKNGTDSTIKINNFKCYKGMNVQDAINNTFGITVMLESFVSHPNGLSIHYRGEQQPLTFIWDDDGTGNLSGIYVNKGQDNEQYVTHKVSDKLLGGD